jgi:hypothetical protein
MNGSKVMPGDVRIDFGRSDISVPEKNLDCAQVCSTFDQVGGEDVAQAVRWQLLANPALRADAVTTRQSDSRDMPAPRRVTNRVVVAARRRTLRLLRGCQPE